MLLEQNICSVEAARQFSSPARVEGMSAGQCTGICVPVCRPRADGSQVEKWAPVSEYLLLSRGSCNVATRGLTMLMMMLQSTLSVRLADGAASDRWRPQRGSRGEERPSENRR